MVCLYVGVVRREWLICGVLWCVFNMVGFLSFLMEGMGFSDSDMSVDESILFVVYREKNLMFFLK